MFLNFFSVSTYNDYSFLWSNFLGRKICVKCRWMLFIVWIGVHLKPIWFIIHYFKYWVIPMSVYLGILKTIEETLQLYNILSNMSSLTSLYLLTWNMLVFLSKILFKMAVPSCITMCLTGDENQMGSWSSM